MTSALGRLALLQALALGRGRRIAAAAAVGLGLANPQPQRLALHTEMARNVGDRPAGVKREPGRLNE